MNYYFPVQILEYDVWSSSKYPAGILISILLNLMIFGKKINLSTF